MTNPLFSLGIGIISILILIFLFFPNGGIIGYFIRLRQMSQRVLIEDALKHIYKTEAEEHPATIQSIAGALSINANKIADLISHMEKEGYVSAEHGEVRLTQEGRKYALHVIRAHRLWERFLAEETGFEETEWHEKAHLYEHSLTKEDLDELAAKLGNPLYDPHGDPIPTSSGEIQNLGGQPLTDIPAGTAVRIVHLENEPQAVYAQIVAEGLYPGMIVQVIESTPTRITFWANGEEHHLAPIIAANIEVKKLPQAIKKDQLNQGIKTLYQIPIGEKAKVIEISPRLRGAERRRFFDLGILPGTIIETEMISPSGETKAYKIRGSLIALRKEQAEAIKVIPLPEVSS